MTWSISSIAFVVTADVDTPLLTITMTDRNPAVAADAANAMAAALVKMATQPASGGAAAIEVLKLVESATPPADASAPRPLFDSALSAAAVLVAMLTLLALVVYLREGRNEPAGAPGA